MPHLSPLSWFFIYLLMWVLCAIFTLRLEGSNF